MLHLLGGDCGRLRHSLPFIVVFTRPQSSLSAGRGFVGCGSRRRSHLTFVGSPPASSVGTLPQPHALRPASSPETLASLEAGTASRSEEHTSELQSRF